MAQISLDIAIPAVRVGFFSGWPIHQDLVPAEQKKESRSIRLEEVYRRKSSYDQRLFQGCCQKPREWSTWRPLVIGNAATRGRRTQFKTNVQRNTRLTNHRSASHLHKSNNRCIRHTQQRQQRRRRQTDGPGPVAPKTKWQLLHSWRPSPDLNGLGRFVEKKNKQTKECNGWSIVIWDPIDCSVAHLIGARERASIETQTTPSMNGINGAVNIVRSTFKLRDGYYSRS